jgi:hypothetical protein
LQDPAVPQLDKETKSKLHNMADLNPPKTAVQDQDINPWSVEGAQGENGEVAAIDYDAICSYVLPHQTWP